MKKTKFEKTGGKQSNLLGVSFEKNTEKVWCDPAVWKNYNTSAPPSNPFEKAFQESMRKKGISFIHSVRTVHIPKKDNGASPKTDRCFLINGKEKFKLSIKQTRSANVAVAELSVDTINKEMREILPDDVLRGMGDFQIRGNQSLLREEGTVQDFKISIAPYVGSLGSLLLSGATSESNDVRVANLFVTYHVDKEGACAEVVVNTIKEKLAKIKGKGTFGTGFSWTYATGTRGRKIQFKVATK